MAQYTFLCLCLDDDGKQFGGIFSAEAFGGGLVAGLKRVVKAKKAVLTAHLDADQLTLWKLSIPVPAGAQMAVQTERDLKLKNINFPDPASNEASEGNGMVQFLDPCETISHYWEQSPDTDYLHILVRMPPGHIDALGKRKRGEPVDISKTLMDKWNKPFLPEVGDLRTYLDAPLHPEEKIPISGMEWRKLLQEDVQLPDTCYPTDLERLFTRSEDETCALFGNSLPEAIVHRPPDLAGTEDMFHSFWDRNIMYILSRCLDWPRWIRNSNRGTHTGTLRPNVGLFLRQACTFRGEEKKPLYNGKHPRQELGEKTRWVYDPAPYILGYHAVGTNVTIATIQSIVDAFGNKQTVVTDILMEDLSTRQGRIKNAIHMVRLVKVLRALEHVVERDVDVDMITVTREDGKSIQFFETRIRKVYPDENKVFFLKSIYDTLKLKGVPNVDRLTRIETAHPDYGCFLELEPRGDAQGPKSVNDVKNAVMCILEALEILHAEPAMFHRDIRWPNVLRNIAEHSQWFLIDWEDASFAPTKAAPNLRQDTHAPQVFKDGHGAEVDIWSVGELIETAQVTLPKNLRLLGRKMLDGSILSAEQALQELRSLPL